MKKLLPMALLLVVAFLNVPADAQQIFKKAPEKNGFIINIGQIRDQNGLSNPMVKYLLNAPGLNVQLRQDGFSYDTYFEHPSDTKQKHFHRVDISLEGANPEAKNSH